MWFFDGVIVVGCVVNVVTKHHENRALKIRHLLQIYFERSLFRHLCVGRSARV
jgi:hypothetical protein